jgi:hypothetical protein
MQNITSTTELKNAIQLLEIEQVEKLQLLKEQFYVTCESFKPVNILKNTLRDLASSANMMDAILGTAMGLGVSYLVKSRGAGISFSIFRKLIGSFLQFGAKNIFARHSDDIRSIGQVIFKNIFHKRNKIQ